MTPAEIVDRLHTIDTALIWLVDAVAGVSAADPPDTEARIADDVARLGILADAARGYLTRRTDTLIQTAPARPASAAPRIRFGQGDRVVIPDGRFGRVRTVTQSDLGNIAEVVLRGGTLLTIDEHRLRPAGPYIARDADAPAPGKGEGS